MLRPEVQEAVDYLTKVVGGEFPIDCPEREVARGYTIRLIDVENELEGLADLHADHYAEVETRSDAAINIKYSEYKRLARARQLCFFGLTFENKVVGYLGVHFAKSLIHGLPVASEDVLFVSKPHRKGLVAVCFIRCALEAMKNSGIHEFVTGARGDSPRLARLYDYLGLKPLTIVYSKVL